eukprot:m.78042 g.78042  ORF g.78042 m.78042 type:complete len:330 (+) comp7943_c0_seq2:1766-2755(+)
MAVVLVFLALAALAEALSGPRCVVQSARDLGTALGSSACLTVVAQDFRLPLMDAALLDTPQLCAATNLVFSGVAIAEVALPRLVRALKRCQLLQSLTCWQNDLEGEEAAAAIMELAAALPSLHTLHIADNSLRDSGATAIAAGLARTTVARLVLADTDIGSLGAATLAAALNGSALRELEYSGNEGDLDANRFGIFGAQGFASALPTSSLEQLVLSGLAIGPDELEVLASGLSRESPLKRISLHGNAINDEGFRSLAGALARRSPLQLLVLTENALTTRSQALVKEMRTRGVIVDVDHRVMGHDESAELADSPSGSSTGPRDATIHTEL